MLWSAGIIYGKNYVVEYGGVQYRSKQVVPAGLNPPPINLSYWSTDLAHPGNLSPTDLSNLSYTRTETDSEIATALAAYTGDKITGLIADWNGTTGTNNTATIQAAINAAYVSGTYGVKHKKLVIPTGKYAVTSLTLGSATDRNGIILEGDGGPVVLVGTQDGANVINILGNDVTIRNIIIDRKAGHTTGHGIAILSQIPTTVIRDNLENVVVQNQPQDGISVVRGEHCRFVNTAAYSNGRYGIGFTNSAPGNPNTGVNFGFENILTQCKVQSNASTGLYFDGQSNCLIEAIEALNNNANGGATGRQIHLDNAGGLSNNCNTFIAPDIENWGGDGLGIGIDILGNGNNVFGGSGWQLKFGIYLRSARTNTILGFNCARSGTLAGSCTVIVDGGAQYNVINVPFGQNMAGQTGYDANALGNYAFNNERLELRASKIAGFVRTLTANSATPDVRYSSWWQTANTTPTSITSFTTTSVERILVFVKDSNTTFVNGTNLKLPGNADYAASNGDILAFESDGTGVIWGRIIYSSNFVSFTQTNSVSVTNTTVETNIAGTGIGNLVLPANFWTVGKTLRFKAEGYYSTAASSPGTIITKFKLGSVVAGGYSPGYALLTSLVNRRWKIEGTITCRSTGSTGTIIFQGSVEFWTGAGAIAPLSVVSTANTTIDTTASQTITLTGTFSVADPANSMTCTNLVVESIN